MQRTENFLAEPRVLVHPTISAAAFKRHQHGLDVLIEQTERVVMLDAQALPESLRDAIRRSFAGIYGKVPPWLEQVTKPVDMLDHLFVAEGRLRQQYYSDREIELDDAG